MNVSLFVEFGVVWWRLHICGQLATAYHVMLSINIYQVMHTNYTKIEQHKLIMQVTQH